MKTGERRLLDTLQLIVAQNSTKQNRNTMQLFLFSSNIGLGLQWQIEM